MTGAQLWRSLLFVHWAFPPDVLRPFIPPGLDLDTFDGKAYVGLVPFTMPSVKIATALPIPLRFHETNVRTYVHRGDRAGVWFFSLDAASTLAVLGARAIFHLPYFRADMTLEAAGDEIAYRSARRWPRPTPAVCVARCRVGAPIGTARDGTLAHFLVERYSLFSRGRGGRILRGDVHHHPYPLRAAELHDLDETLLAAAGLARPPEVASVLFSDGVDVRVTGPSRA